jgi:hypothetical protein
MSYYNVRWNDVWQPYVEFKREQDPQHLSYQLFKEVESTSISNKLSRLNNYYALVDKFTNLARSVKAQPGNAETLRQLNALEKELIKPGEDTRKVYKEYAQTLRESLKSLDDIAEYVKVRVRMGKLQNKPGAQETKLLTSILGEVQSISNDLGRDAQYYINDTATALATIKAAV